MSFSLKSVTYMKRFGVMLVAMLFFVTVPAYNDADERQGSEPLATHTPLAEFGTATWCGYCKYAHAALKNVYAGTITSSPA